MTALPLTMPVVRMGLVFPDWVQERTRDGGQISRRGRLRRREMALIRTEILMLDPLILPSICLTDEAYDALITLHNYLSPELRRAEAQHCKSSGHEFVAMNGGKLCRRCIWYIRAGF